MALALKLYQRRALASLERFFESARLANPADAFAATVDPGLSGGYKPMPGLHAVPYVCLRIPTGGGKTVMGAHIIQAAGRALLEREFPLVLWMVPTTQIKTQTLQAFADPRHPYRQELDDAFGGQVAVFDIADFTRMRPADLGTRVCIVIATVAALRVENQEGRRVYEYQEDLEAHFVGSARDLPYLDKGIDGKALASFANLLRMHGPLVIMDEAHNATTALSYTVYERLGPRAVVELTATPDTSSSNVLVSVSAFELKAENMIKFPVVLKEHGGEWQAAVSNAVARRKSLARSALAEPDYIRPILLVQAESARGTATVEEVRRHLIESAGVPENTIAVATGEQRDLDGVDLLARDCPIEVVITKQALKEGWDCSFAYVFCSVAQVKSDKDVQQLLGRILRMPHATRRRQDAMNKAYAHVVTDSFGRAAGELTQSLIDIGFNPMEAAVAIRTERQGDLPLQGGTAAVPQLPTARIAVTRPPDLDEVPERDRQRVVFVPSGEGRGGTIEVTDEIDVATTEAIVAAAPARERDAAATQLQLHHNATAAAKAPSEHGATFSVPRLCRVEQGELELVDRGAVPDGFTWDLLTWPPDLSSFHFREESMTFEVDLDGRQVNYRQIKDDVTTYLPGFALDRSETDLVGWLDHEIRDPSVRQPVLREWLRRAIHNLVEDRGFSLAQLLKGQYVLRRKLAEQLQLAREQALKEGFQQALFGGDPELVATLDDPGINFAYPANMALYPARRYYEGSYRFRKHYYPVPGDLDWKTSGGRVTEEFECARAIDLLEEVAFWVRNLVHPSQFWMPTSRQRTYPDFVAKLKDGRLFVVEYKGEDRFSSDEEKEKRLVGELWARRSKGKALYLMTRHVDDAGRNVREQLLRAIN